MILGEDMKVVCIVIPVYKNVLSELEIVSMLQCFKILGKYHIYFVCSRKINTSYYTSLLVNETNYSFEYFDEFFFESIEGYNKLLMSTDLYERFLNYKYMLIYQLDAYVFKDELDYWCSLNYDYIGAPWLKMDIFKWFSYKPYPKFLILFHKVFGKGKCLSKVGNGGFSLRKINSCLYNLRLFKRVVGNWKANEDSFFSHYVKTFNPFFQIPDELIAMKFSFDINPEFAYHKINVLPFGCHAWSTNKDPYKNNLDFWRKFILKDSDEITKN